MRLGAIFVAVCMVIIAGSAGAIVHFYFGVGAAEATGVGIAALTALALYNTVATRIRARAALGRQLADLSGGVAELARQVGDFGRRLAALESRIEDAVDRTRATTDPLTLEIGELGTLLTQLADTVADHQLTLDALARVPVPPPAPAPPPAGVLAAEALAQRLAAATPAAAEAVPAEEPPSAPEPKPEPKPAPQPEIAPEPPPAPPAAVATAPDARAQEAALASIRSAIDANRVDLYLQPIVTLPQRKVRYYEAMSRLRNESGEVVHAADFIPQAESGGLMPRIDNLVIFRCVQVTRRLLLKNRDIGLFCNLSASTLTDSAYFTQLLEFMDANRAIAPSLVLEFAQGAVRAMGPIEHESLAALADRGYRFSLDNVADLRIEPRELADRGFRFIKVAAGMLLNRGGTAASDIHPADLSDLLGRFGIDLIAERIESEGSVVDLLDYDVRFGQGFLFSPPRPVRAEALQGLAERADVVARDAAADPVPPATAAGRGAQPPAAEATRSERISALTKLARSR